MSKWIHFLVLIGFSSTLLGLDDSLLQRADRLLQEGLAQDAIPVYQEVLSRNPNDHTTELRLAEAFFMDEKYTETTSLLVKQETLSTQHQVLLAAAYNRLEDPKAAIKSLATLSETCCEAHFELGKAHLLENQLDLAKEAFEKIPEAESPLYHDAKLQLARIYLLKKDDQLAEKILNDLSARIKSGDTLEFEIAFFKGLIRFRASDFAKAATHFEKALPAKNADKTSWYGDTLYYLGWSYLKMGDGGLLPLAAQKELLNKSEAAFLKLAALANDERIQLSLGQYYLIRAARLDDKGAYTQAEQILTRAPHHSPSQTLLIKAQGASTYNERAQLYKQLINESPNTLSGWFLSALNDFEEARTQLAEGHLEEAKVRFESAATLFRDAHERIKHADPAKGGLCVIYLAKCLDKLNKTRSALKVLTELSPESISQLEEPDEVDFLKGFLSAKLNDAKTAEDYLKQLIVHYPSGRFCEEALNLLGILAYRQERHAEAETYFKQLAEEYPDSYLAGDALALAANACDSLRQPARAKEYRQKCFERYATCPLAGEAYFNYYTYREYLQGDRQAIKHLSAFPERFPDSHFRLSAHYLMGIDQTRDRKTPEGKSIRKKNLTAAIDELQQVENLYETLKIPPDRQEYYISLRFRATLDRAQNNLAIADEASGAKKAIYLEYAEEVLCQMMEKLENKPSPEPYPHLLEECQYWLAQTYLKQENDPSAKEMLETMLDRYRLAKTTRGYFLSRVWSELAGIAMREKDYNAALKALVYAEDASKGKVLSTDQRLDLWIQQSLSYQGLNQLDQAILILSKVINDDAVSVLRLKAMYLRAELYERQERPELARKQLEAIAKKGGEWALKAKDKLDKDYGYQ